MRGAIIGCLLGVSLPGFACNYPDEGGVREARRGAVTCYWPVEVRAEGKLWRRYLVTPDGKNVRLKE